MFEWISANLGNIAAVAVILLIVALAIRSMLRKKTSCSCGCGACPVADTCHKEEKR